MRYEDSSQAGAFSGQSDGQGPEARDDMDTLAAGARGPVTGNVISGEGTQYGAASSDLSAADAQVTALTGAGGQDTSFSGGELSVTGEYGKLSIDAEGNYSYLANQGAPENSRDRFTYTLADKQGNSDTAALTIEIGKTPVVIQANAQQVVVGPDGVVILPAGVQLSDIHVVGRNLVVNLPDGSQMVIIDGAVFVPQLVLGTVEVPATNLAALLIDSEPRPAAGTPPPSSGGNFGLPPGPLDPGVPLGDLLPPTEMAYTPPDVREVNGILDRKPEIFVDPGNGVPVENAVDSVNEAGLPTRNEGEPQGSGEEAAAGANGDPSEATNGTIVFNSPDDPNVITINGIVVTGVVGQVIPGDFGNLVLTSFGDGTIGYTYTLFDNTSGNTTHDDFEIVITDSDGDSDTATLVVNIVDDVPTARPDTDSIAAGQYGPATGNVITDAAAGDVGDSDTNAADTVGADDASLTSVSGAGGSDSTFNEGGNLVVNGQYGVLTIDADGNYSYVRNQGTPGGVNDVFNYTITDGDGDTSSSTLTISIGDATPETRPNPTALLDDDALANGNPGGVGDDPNSVDVSGNLTGVGGDGPLVFAVQLTGAPAGFTYVSGGAGVVLIQQGGVTVLTVTVNSATGAYTVVQNAPIDHPAGLDENNVSFTVNYTVTDQDGDSAPGTININVDDDTPTIGREDVGTPTLTVDETNLALNATADFSGVFDTSFGADGAGTLGYAVSVVNGTDSGLVDVATGQSIFLFNNAGVVEGRVGGVGGAVAFSVSVNAATGVVTLDQVRALDHPSNPNPDDSVSPDADSIQLTATIIDGDGDPASLTINIGDQLSFEDDGPSVAPVLNADATVTVDESLPSNDPAINLGGITAGNDPDLAGGLALGQANSGVAIVDANAVFGADGPAAGGGISYALVLGVNDTPLTLTDGSTITLQLVGGVVVGVVDNGPFAGQAAFAIAIDATTGVVSVEQYLSLDHPSNPNPNDPLGLGANTVGVTVTATDGDGDPVTSGAIDISGQITLLDDGPSVAPVLNADATVTVDESLPSNDPAINLGGITAGNDPDLAGGLALGQANSGVAIVDANAVFGADGPAAGSSLTYALSVTNVSSGVTLTDGTAINLQNVGGVIVGVVQGAGPFAGQAAFAISINATTGVVTVEQYLSLDHPTNPDQNEALILGAGSVGVTVTATDGDGDPVTSDAVDISGNISFLDDGPSAANDTDTIVGGNGPATGNVITGVDFVGGDANGTDGSADAPGADGGSITRIASNNVPANVDTTFTAGNLVVAGQYGVLTISANGNYSYLRNDGTPGGVSDVFTYTLTDGDGDTVTATLTIGIDDNFPTLPDPAIVRLDDDALAGGNPAGTGDDVNSAGLPGQLAGTGGDGDLDYAFTGTNTLPAGFTVNPVNASTLQILQGATVVLTITLDTETGAFNVVQNNPIDHLAGDNENNYQFVIGVEVEDADGDSDPANITINVDDDTPTVSANAAVQVDDDALAGGNPAGTGDVDPDTANLTGTLGHSFGADGAGSVAYLTTGAPAGFTYELSGGNLLVKQGTTTVLTLTVNPTTGAYTVVQNAPIAHAAGGNENDIAFAINYRVTDGDGDTVDGTLTINSDDDTPVAANDTDTIASGSVGPATGNVITDAAAGDAGDTDTGADSVGADGGAAIVGLASNNVPANVDNDPAGGFVVAGAFGTLTLQADGNYSYLRNDGAGAGQNEVFTYTLTDADGDTTTATLTIAIADATPTLPDPAAVLLDDDALAGGNAAGTGDDINSSGTPGQLLGSGGDGDLDYAFTGVNTLPAGFSVNVVNAGQIQILQGATVVLTVTLTTESGAFTVVQNNPIDHAAGLDENNTSFSIGVQVVDVDGDVEPATISINVDDDTPVNFTPVALTDTTDATVIAQDDALVNDGAALATRLINDANNDGTGENFIGADGFGSLVFTATGHIDGEPFENAGGDPLTSGNLPIYVFGFGTGVLTATTSDDNSDAGAVVFTVTLNPNAGFGSASTYTIDFNQTIDNGSGITFDNLTSSKAGNVDVRGVGADDPLTTVDLLLTASGVGGVNATINTDSDSIGSGNQSMDEGETVRIDFVTNLEDDPTDDLVTFPSGFSYDGHVGTRSLLQTIPQVQGSQTETVAFRVYALNTTVTDAASPDDYPADGFLDASIVAVTHVTIDGFDDGPDPLNPLQPAVTVALGPVGDWTTVDYGVSARLESDGSVTFSGVQQGDQYGITTGADFNAVAVSSLPAGIGPVGEESSTNSFDLGVFSIGVVDTGDPINLSFDVTATDGDGDTSTGTIDVTLVPDTVVALAADAKSTAQVMREPANDDGFSSLSSNDTQKYGGPGNTGIVAGALAAAGMMAMPVAAAEIDDQRFELMPTSIDLGLSQQMVGRVAADDLGGNGLGLGNELRASAFDVTDLASSSHGFDDFSSSSLSLTDLPLGNVAQDPGAALAIDQGPSFDFAVAATFAPMVAMPAAEQLAGAGLTGNVQFGGSVEKVLADALGGNGGVATIDALLEALPGQGFGGEAGLDALTSPIADHVPAWDMGAMGAFVPGADMMFRMDVAMFHHDVVQPVVNG